MLTLSNAIVTDATDGHTWITVPESTFMGSFPNPVIVAFMQTPKENFGAIVDMTGELGRVEINFDQVHDTNDQFNQLGPGFNSIVSGSIRTLTLPDTLPKGQVVASLVVIDKYTTKPCAIVNLRNVISLENINKITLHFGAIVYFAEKTVKSFTNVKLSENIFIDFRTFMLEIKDPFFVGNRVKYSSKTDYNNLRSSQGDNWVENYEKIGNYTMSQVSGPTSRVIFTQRVPTVVVSGIFTSTIGNYDIKSFIAPYCPGLAIVLIIDRFVKNGVTSDTFNMVNNERLDINLMLDLIKV